MRWRGQTEAPIPNLRSCRAAQASPSEGCAGFCRLLGVVNGDHTCGPAVSNPCRCSRMHGGLLKDCQNSS